MWPPAQNPFGERLEPKTDREIRGAVACCVLKSSRKSFNNKFGNCMWIANEYYLIVDLEATCSNEGAVPRHEMEIVEIGAVMQSSQTFEVESQFQTFVHPVRHPE